MTLLNAARFVAGVLCLGIYCWMLTHKVSSRIRNSRYWPIGWLGALLILSMGGKLLIPFFDYLPIDDEVAVPLLFGTMVFLIIIAFSWQMYKLKRQINNPPEILFIFKEKK
jgi:drug/metabolite transporter (DMT)-like permease